MPMKMHWEFENRDFIHIWLNDRWYFSIWLIKMSANERRKHIYNVLFPGNINYTVNLPLPNVILLVVLVISIYNWIKYKRESEHSADNEEYLRFTVTYVTNYVSWRSSVCSVILIILRTCTCQSCKKRRKKVKLTTWDWEFECCSFKWDNYLYWHSHQSQSLFEKVFM